MSDCRRLMRTLAVAGLLALPACGTSHGTTGEQAPEFPVLSPAASLPPAQAAECTAVTAAVQAWLATGTPTTLRQVEALSVSQVHQFAGAVRKVEDVLTKYHDVPTATLNQAFAQYGLDLSALGLVIVPSVSPSDLGPYRTVAADAGTISSRYRDFGTAVCRVTRARREPGSGAAGSALCSRRCDGVSTAADRGVSAAAGSGRNALLAAGAATSNCVTGLLHGVTVSNIMSHPSMRMRRKA
jgi:hypothetical protein